MFDLIKNKIMNYFFIISKQPVLLKDLLVANDLYTEKMSTPNYASYRRDMIGSVQYWGYEPDDSAVANGKGYGPAGKGKGKGKLWGLWTFSQQMPKRKGKRQATWLRQGQRQRFPR